MMLKGGFWGASGAINYELWLEGAALLIPHPIQISEVTCN